MNAYSLTRLVSLVFLVFLLVLSALRTDTTAIAATTVTPRKQNPLETSWLNALKSKKMNKKNWSIEALVPATGQVLLSHLNAEPRVPASTTKILTAYAALKRLGLTTTFKTQLKSSGSISNSQLKGDLCLVGGGDPMFVSESMWRLVNHFTRTNVQNISGNLVVDSSFFDSIHFDSSREDHRVDRAYDAPVGAASFNWNSLNFYIRPSASAGAPALVIADPVKAYAKIINRTHTVDTAKTSKRVQVQSVAHADPTARESFEVSGAVAATADEVVKYVPVDSPDLWTGYAAREFLAQRGIKLMGQVVSGRCTDNSRVLGEHESPPLYEQAIAMMKYSNNFIAETLTKHIAARQGHSDQQLKYGTQAILQTIEKLKLKHQERIRILNPSGLTRENRLTVSFLNALLRAIDQDPTLAAEFKLSLPASNGIGTLQTRSFKAPAVHGRVRAKTGLLTGVVALSGWVFPAQHPPVIVSAIFNGPAGQTTAAKELLDQWIANAFD